MPKVSIIISTYNDAEFLPKTLDSVLKQSFFDLEVLVINDASADNTDKILRAYAEKDSRVKLFYNQQRRGLTANLNFGLHQATGELIARLDSDDEWIDPAKLQKQVEFLNFHKEVGLVGCFAQCVDQKGNRIFVIKPPQTDQDIRKQILSKNCFVHSAILARKNIIQDSGGYPANAKYVEDYGLWLRLGLKAKLWNLPEIMVNYQMNRAGITQTKNLEQIRGALHLIQQYRTYYPNFYRAWIKWMVQFVVTKIFGSQVFFKFKC